jgi:hypothetical protein
MVNLDRLTVLGGVLNALGVPQGQPARAGERSVRDVCLRHVSADTPNSR